MRSNRPGICSSATPRRPSSRRLNGCGPGGAISPVTGSSPVFERFPWLLREQGMDTYSYQGSVCPYTRLPDTWHEFRQQLSQKTRYHLTRKRAKLDERHQWKVELFQSPSDDIDLAVREFIAVHEQR